MEIVVKGKTLSNHELIELRKIYWETASYVKDIAEGFNIKRNDVYKYAGAKKYTCKRCSQEVVQEKRLSREERISDHCSLCNKIISAEFLYDEMRKEYIVIENFIKDINKIKKNITSEEFEKILDVIIYKLESKSSLKAVTYKMKQLDLLKNRIMEK